MTSRPSSSHLGFLRSSRIGWCSFLGLLFLMGAGSPDDAEIAKRVTEVSKHIMCMCKDNCNKVLINCNCSYSDGFRAEIAELARSGKSNEEIIQHFIDRYGEIVLAAPTTEGFNMTAWVLPFVMLLIGAGIVAFVLRRWKSRISASGGGETTGSGEREKGEAAGGADLEEELDRALEEFDY